ncbi:unnamed protein product [Lepeophtheirus salmonis]|uniref:(salmon louse) hypothetical protein n=1 Tax=Lepeophtheirus salmonis TaxID=72036 RepID=A0A7R8D970_LEPSM|nr:unnamed protein product [Lepeophtheirus salmonis]CAF3015012.1 unnamed protein product [Lepeophtheirus salmonis]
MKVTLIHAKVRNCYEKKRVINKRKSEVDIYIYGLYLRPCSLEYSLCSFMCLFLYDITTAMVPTMLEMWDNHGKPSGFGVFYNSSGNLEYRGEWRDGTPNGNGTWYGINGDVYEGDFMNGDGTWPSHGKGVLRGKDGHKIEGYFKRGMVHGPGVWHGPNGDTYEGMFRMGKPTGFAKVFDKQGNLMYEGRVEQKKLPFEINITYGY